MVQMDFSKMEGSMQQLVMVAQNTDDDFKPVLAPSDQVAHQFDCVHGNEPKPQIMIQLIGCRIKETRRARQMGRGRTH
jgi:hypothetical protein